MPSRQPRLYDALEGFIATSSSGAARAAMRARVEVDNRITSTTDARIDSLIGTASRLRAEYRVPTAGQAHRSSRSTPSGSSCWRWTRAWPGAWTARSSAGSRRRSKQPGASSSWSSSAIRSTRGAFYQTDGQERLRRIHRLLRDHGVQVVMAGDTHDLEYYVERHDTPAGRRRCGTSSTEGAGPT